MTITFIHRYTTLHYGAGNDEPKICTHGMTNMSLLSLKSPEKLNCLNCLNWTSFRRGGFGGFGASWDCSIASNERA